MSAIDLNPIKQHHVVRWLITVLLTLQIPCRDDSKWTRSIPLPLVMRFPAPWDNHYTENIQYGLLSDNLKHYLSQCWRIINHAQLPSDIICEQYLRRYLSHQSLRLTWILHSNHQEANDLNLVCMCRIEPSITVYSRRSHRKIRL